MAEAIPAAVRDLLTLHLTPGLGPNRIAALLARFGSATAVLQAGPEELAEVDGLGGKLAAGLPAAWRGVDVAGELASMERFGARLLATGEAEYPPALAETSGHPVLLYVRGELKPDDGRAVALVGSRHCTDYGRRLTTRLAADLVRASVTVVSGLARGIDGIAHRAALQAGGRTLAVLAGGLSRIYPPEHAGLAAEIEKAGAVMTESCMGQEPLPGLFPVRNRIISGLSAAVVVVEAAERSGALATAHHAAEQGRTVLAVPGSVESEASAGCHALLRQGAILCRGVEDILEEIDGVSARVTAEKEAASLPAVPPAPHGPPPGLDQEQRRIWEALTEPRHLDELVQQLGLGVPQISGILMMMEMRKAVRRLPGNRYERM